jgi:hypothetical protein
VWYAHAYECDFGRPQRRSAGPLPWARPPTVRRQVVICTPAPHEVANSSCGRWWSSTWARRRATRPARCRAVPVVFHPAAPARPAFGHRSRRWPGTARADTVGATGQGTGSDGWPRNGRIRPWGARGGRGGAAPSGLRQLRGARGLGVPALAARGGVPVGMIPSTWARRIRPATRLPPPRTPAARSAARTPGLPDVPSLSWWLARPAWARSAEELARRNPTNRPERATGRWGTAVATNVQTNVQRCIGVRALWRNNPAPAAGGLARLCAGCAPPGSGSAPHARRR